MGSPGASTSKVNKQGTKAAVRGHLCIKELPTGFGYTKDYTTVHWMGIEKRHAYSCIHFLPDHVQENE